MSDEVFEATTVYARAARINRDLLLEQAGFIYDLAMEEYSKNKDKYRLLMGVANMLYMIDDGKYQVTIVENFDNMGVY